MNLFFNNPRLRYFIIVMLIPSVLFLSGCQKKAKIAPEEKAYQKKYVDFSPKLKVEKNNIIKNIDELSSEKYEGRKTGTQGEAEAALFLASYLKNLNISPYGDVGYFHSFTDPLSGVSGDNILGILKKPDVHKYIIISSNYDHLGTVKGKIYPGANQNASGVAAVMEMARIFSKNFEKMNYNIVFAFWSGHEQNLSGSKAYMESLNRIEEKNIAHLINLDTIGTFGARDYIIWRENDLSIDLINELSSWKDFSIIESSRGADNSDHYYFGIAGIPSISIRSKDWETGSGSLGDNRYGVNMKNVNALTQNLINYIYNLKQVEDNAG